MAEESTKSTKAEPIDKPEKTARVGLGIGLTPVNNSDQPVVANYTNVNVSPGMVFIDFGFIEPAMLSALPLVAKRGGKLPERVNGKLASRVVMECDAMAGLHQQLGRVLEGVRTATERDGGK